MNDQGGNQNPVSNIGQTGAQEFGAVLDAASKTSQGGDTGPSGGASGGSQTGQASQTATQQPGQQTPPTQDPTANTAASTQQAQTPAQGQAPVTTPAQPDVAAVIKSTADAIVAAQQRTTGQAVAGAQKPTSPFDLSGAEFDQHFKVIRPTPQVLNDILGQDPKKALAALDYYGQGLVQQAVTMAFELANAKHETLRSEFSPHISSWQNFQRQQRETEIWDKFTKSNPDLAGEKELLQTIKDSFVMKIRSGQMQNFPSDDAAISAVATTARQILKRVSPQGSPTGQPNGQNGTGGTSTQSQGRTMSAASTAGRAGTGQATAKGDVETIFGEYYR